MHMYCSLIVGCYRWVMLPMSSDAAHGSELEVQLQVVVLGTVFVLLNALGVY